MIDILQKYTCVISIFFIITIIILWLFELKKDADKRVISRVVNKNLGIILLLISILVALLTFDEYGMSWDETVQWKSGRISFEYIFSDSSELLEWQDRDYGVAFELPLYIIERLLNLHDPRRIFLLRHFLTHTFFLIAGYFNFKLVDYIYKNKSLAAIGFGLFLFHPRIYSHSFFNTKDIPFLAMFVICLYFYAVAFDKKRPGSFVVLGINTGLLINLRLMGIMLFFLVLGFLLIDLILEKKLKTEIKLAVIYTITVVITLYLSWPFLWINPLENFIYAISNLSQARYSGLVLFNGDLLHATELSWTYFPKWFLMTTPISYLLVGLFGSILIVINLLRDPIGSLTNNLQRNNLLFLVCFFSPIVLVLSIKPNLYDGWRQLYFLYPFFVLNCLYGINYLLKGKFKRPIYSLSLISFIAIGYFMVGNFPIQYVYFNQLVDTRTPEYLRHQFDLDYWGITYKQSLEYIVENDHSPTINIYVDGAAGRYNWKILPSSERERLNYVDKEEATYFVTNYRQKPSNYDHLKHAEWHSIMVGNNTVSTIFKLK